ncbi:gliding motility-associated C-terminal domain-containing protein [Mariniflexile gromovii]|uniref:Gliding motility-associated C-terminal domain-containing protein n=1 Tax=Mariniflexile gromovii TaxID=362523 RepID=A0ABS4BVN9_9FLAO|nr:gliding motility-associated C-terminal domain-containing protein [Mariniflexile gromovii]MBP0904654.1 gliding motility-associated C-terminal domain-containing protein [Mariniflexile gromovii]
MITKLLSRKVIKITLSVLMLLWTSFSSFAQCPTVSNPNPAPICNAAGYSFANLSADYAPGAVWYSAAIGGIRYNSTQLVTQGTYYAGNNVGNCGTRQSINVTFQVNPVPVGASLDKFYCSNDNATIQDYIDDALVGYIPVGGTVNVYYDINMSNEANTTDAVTNGIVNYYIVFSDGTMPTPCTSQIKFGKSIQSVSPANPTPTPNQEFCSDSNPTIGDLNPGTTANYNWYEQVDAFGDPIPPILLASEPLTNGTYYVQVTDAFCNSDAIPVTVTIDDPVQSGASASLEYCDDSLPANDFNLFDELGAPKVTTGSWSGPLVTSGGYLGTVNISTLTTAGTYVFSYTVPTSGACPNGVATVSITVFETLSSGIPSAINPATFCESAAPSNFDLFSLLDNEDLNGQWTQGTLSTDPVVTSPIDLSSFIPGTYDFTYTQNLLPNPCTEQSTTVQVVILPDPNTGVAVNQIFCENDLAANSPFDLFTALDGSQDNNSGTWTDASNTPVTNPIDLTNLTVAGSPYKFNYTIDNGTCSDTEAITITVQPSPESGTANAPAIFCEDLAPASYNLFDLLTGEDTAGTWFSGTNNLGAIVSSPVDLSVLAPGDYDFTYDVDAIGSCDDALVTVTITINPLPVTGTPTPAIFCENDLAANSPLDLFGQLSGQDPGGTWTDDNTSGALSGSEVNLNALTIGSYNFTYIITDANGCTNSSTVLVRVDDAPESGTANAPVLFCEDLAPASYNLFDSLTGADVTGTWFSGTDNLGATVSNPVDLSVLAPGDYNFTYDVDAIGSCDDELVTVTITINALPVTGTPTPAIFCENDLAANSPLDLFGQLSGEDAGGTWTDDNTTGALSGSDVNLNALTIGSYNFTYTITDANGCTNSSTVLVRVDDAPESGTVNAPMEFCMASITAGQTYNLFDLLTDEDSTGSWSDDDSTGALSGNLVTIDGLSAGTYNFTYDVDAIGSCDDVLVTVSIIINDAPSPIAAATQEFCDTATVSDLTATGTTIQWYDNATGGSPLAGSVALVDSGTYYASQTDATTNCESSVRTLVTVTIYQSPKSGNPNPISVCNTNLAVDLFIALDGSQDATGVWQDIDGTGALTGSSFDASAVAPGTYQFNYLVTASAPCVDANTITTITVEPPLSAGTDNTLDVCSNNGTTDLFTLIGSADTGGTWAPAMASGTGVFNPLVDAPGVYSYTVTNACGSDTSNVTVTVTQTPNAGTDNATIICIIDGQIDLFTLLGTSAQSGGTWSPSLTSGSSIFDPNSDASGTYIYTVTAVSPCSSDASAQITVTVNDSPQIIVIEQNPSFCLVDNPTVTDLTSSIRPTGTVNWYADAALTIPLNLTDTLIDGEDYFATQTTGSGCESSMSVQINVTINDTPTPTIKDSSKEYCINDAPTIYDLSLNLNEYAELQDNVVWYDAHVNGTVFNNTDVLTNLTTYYAALIDAATGCESSVRLAVTPDLTACGELFLPDGFSPNGDGINDTYDYDNLDVLYPNFEIEIYNRYGNIVYKGNASSPRFNGISNQARTMLKGDLPVGMYYYIFNFNDGKNKPKQGHLYLSR